ncbi:GntR family transcriptional regulator [Pontitalea aquivivens]|uniref:GntR family transcriptional regulator n=1 Tax=Pontitalea aquivivens TaxID=3388663 RepID=UPI0039707EEF
MSRRGEAKTLVIDVSQRLRQRILGGVLRPGDRLQPGQLSKEFGASTTVIREALLLLGHDRLVQSSTGQGYFVSRLNQAEFRDLTKVRCHVETLALTLAIERGSLAWESELTAVHHRLVRTERKVDDQPQTSSEWFKAHRDFHAKLIEACRISTLIDFSETLANATELYRVWFAQTATVLSRDVEREHSDILSAVIARDAGKACALLVGHYTTTMENLLALWPGEAPGPAK